MILLFLGWEKAFDRVDQHELMNAVSRLNIPPKILRILKAFYINPQFRLKDREGKSSYRRQRAGIGQGRPLSPYLFVLLMTVLFHDVHKRLDRLIQVGKLNYFDYWELLYADDTLLVGKPAREINMLLHAIEEESDKYNMRLNKAKCEYVGMFGSAQIKFKNGTAVKRVEDATYLGSKITRKADRNTEVVARLSKALNTASRLKCFWKKANASLTWKLQIYNAIIISQVVYGLDVMHMTQALYNKLDAFHYRGLRIALGIDHSSWSRVSNQRVLEKANIVANKGHDLSLTWEQFLLVNSDAVHKIVPISEIIQRRQRAILGHVLRADGADPMYQISFNDDCEVVVADERRSGWPRQHFLEENIQDVYWDLFR